ncbi:efflux RND transporter permease subunit [Cellvibrio sp. ARAG 10.3]|uniref:efflux RND transporter permease subunit n=1 Tax=Cellvibrio sp. ARAG 10.3 TaxID=3451358 RepID=UPI003F46F8AE
MNRLIQWFVENRVAANLLMVFIFIGGFASLGQLDKEVFPMVARNIIEIEMNYPGAGPTEVEEQIAIRIEEAIADIDGIYEITSRSRQGRALVTVEVTEGYDAQQILNDIKTRVDAINTFPPDVERPITRRQLRRSPLMSLALYGDVDEAALKETGWRVRNELALLPGISLVQLNGTRPYEMSIEISEANLRRYQLTFDAVAHAIRGASLNLPAGVIKTPDGDIQIQTRAQADTAEEFGRIPVLTRADGSKLLLRDIAEVRDGFSDQDIVAQFNGKRAVFLELSITENPDIIAATAEVERYLAQAKHTLPAGIQLEVWRDMSKLFEGRLNLLLSNAFSGLILVFIVLMLFLRPLLAIWVCVGIATAFAGAIWLLPHLGVSINMISLFAFLLVLGIVVDDAIIVGESIYTRQQHGIRGNASAASGAKMVSVPVFFAVISTMIFFVPMLSIPGTMGSISYPIPVVVILCLFFSLVESLLILPAHLAHMKPEGPSRFASLRWLATQRHWLAGKLDYLAGSLYQPALRRMLAYKGAVLVAFTLAFAITLTLFAAGWLRSSFMPEVPGDSVEARVVLPEGTSFYETRRIMQQVQDAALAVRDDEQLLADNEGEPFIQGIQTWAYGVNIYVAIALQDAEQRQVSIIDINQRWRELIGAIPEAKEFRLDFTVNAVDDDIRLNMSISSNDLDEQRRATEAVRAALEHYAEVFDLRTSLEASRPEIDLRLKPNAEMLGVDLQLIARQVRQAFYGEEVQRIPRGIEDVRVLVRYPEADRQTLEQLNHMRIRTATGAEIPLTEVAEIAFVPGYTVIDRRDRKRSIAITANVQDVGDPNAIVADVLARHLPAWQREFPGFTLRPDGTMRDQADFMASVKKNFMLAVVLIYGLMAISFRSYWQPLLILTAIPFGFMGAVFGHMIMGREVSMLSMLGFIACAGVVVNDNLVLLDRINQLRQQGLDVVESVVQGGRDRFRAILLTSITTFIGLVPIMAEQSVQARFLIPMVISLAFGVLFATLVTLVLVPSLYVTAESVGYRWLAWRNRMFPSTTDNQENHNEPR